MSELSADERAMVRGAKIGFVFQNFSLLARTTALNNVLMPLSYAVRRLSIAESKQRASQLLAHVRGWNSDSTTNHRNCLADNSSGLRSPDR